jgi:hypothetical protein
MHRIKKAINDLENYLGRDTQGLKLLAKVAELANELRKEASTATEAADTDKKRAAERLTELRSVAAARDQLQHESTRLEAKIRQHARDLAAAQSQLQESEQALEELLDEVVPPFAVPEYDTRPASSAEAMEEKFGGDFPEFLKDIAGYTSLLNGVRREMRVAPRCLGVKNAKQILEGVDDIGDKYRQGGHRNRTSEHGTPCEGPMASVVYELTDIISNFSGHELMKLGRFVACITLLGPPVQILTRTPLRAVYKGGNRLSHEVSGKFLSWFRSNIASEAHGRNRKPQGETLRNDGEVNHE